MFTIKMQDDAEAVVLTVSGDVDVATVDQFRQTGLDAIARAVRRPVIIDTAAVVFIDSTGLGGLVALNNAAAAAGTVLKLRAVPPRMATLLRLTAIDAVIPECDDSRL